LLPSRGPAAMPA